MLTRYNIPSPHKWNEWHLEYSNAVEKKITYVTPAALPAVPIV